jgi:protein TonB
MGAPQQGLRLDEQVRAEDLLYQALFHGARSERGSKFIALGVALAIHIVALLINFPEIKFQLIEQKPAKTIYVKKYIPPPPKLERREIIKQVTKRIPIPDPTPDEPEPIREPEPEIEPEPLPPDAEVLIGVPEAPPADTGPLLAGVGDVTLPVRIEETYIKPEYPEVARRARLEGKVTLQAIILKDGTVSEAKVLRAIPPGMGFEEEAVVAVQKWRYHPATQNGNPVDVYFTINVDFELR